MNILDLVQKKYLKTEAAPSFRPGDTLRVHVKIKEGTRERIQVFEGIVIARQHGGLDETFTVRKISNGVGVERIFPFATPMIAGLTVNKRGVVRRARIYYFRNLTGKKARIKERRG